MKEIIKLNFNGMDYSIKTQEYNKISKENLKIIKDFDKENKRKELSNVTRFTNIQFLILLAKSIKKPYKEIKYKDIMNYFDSLDIKKSTFFTTLRTISNHFTSLKLYFVTIIYL